MSAAYRIETYAIRWEVYVRHASGPAFPGTDYVGDVFEVRIGRNVAVAKDGTTIGAYKTRQGAQRALAKRYAKHLDAAA